MSSLNSPTVDLVVSQDLADKTARKIFSFLRLEAGWHFGSGVAPSRRLALQAMAIASELAAAGWSTDAFPGEGGEILVAGSRPSRYLEITVETTLSHSVYAERDGAKEFFKENQSVEQVRDSIQELSSEPLNHFQWSTTGFSIPRTGIGKSGVLLAWLSRIPVMAGSRLQIKHAAKSRAEQPAHTLRSIAPNPYAPRFSGESAQIHYQRTNQIQAQYPEAIPATSIYAE